MLQFTCPKKSTLRSAEDTAKDLTVVSHRVLRTALSFLTRPEEVLNGDLSARQVVLLTNGASLYLKKINDLAVGAISRLSKNPRKLCEKRFFLCSSVFVSP